MWFGAPAAGCWLGAFQGVVAKLVAVVALGRRGEAEASLKSVVGGEGGQAWLLGKVLCLRAGDGDDDSGGEFPLSLFVGTEPSGLLCKCKPSVVGGEFPANVGKRV